MIGPCRGPVFHTIVMMPMMVQWQREGDAIVVSLPSWQLPLHNTVTASSYAMAVEALQQQMREHWGIKDSPDLPA
jgi:hypothetical protein